MNLFSCDPERYKSPLPTYINRKKPIVVTPSYMTSIQARAKYTEDESINKFKIKAIPVVNTEARNCNLQNGQLSFPDSPKFKAPFSSTHSPNISFSSAFVESSPPLRKPTPLRSFTSLLQNLPLPRSVSQLLESTAGVPTPLKDQSSVIQQSIFQNFCENSSGASLSLEKADSNLTRDKFIELPNCEQTEKSTDIACRDNNFHVSINESTSILTANSEMDCIGSSSPRNSNSGLVCNKEKEQPMDKKRTGFSKFIFNEVNNFRSIDPEGVRNKKEDVRDFHSLFGDTSAGDSNIFNFELNSMLLRSVPDNISSSPINFESSKEKSTTHETLNSPKSVLSSSNFATFANKEEEVGPSELLKTPKKQGQTDFRSSPSPGGKLLKILRDHESKGFSESPLKLTCSEELYKEDESININDDKIITDYADNNEDNNNSNNSNSDTIIMIIIIIMRVK
ncbi:rho GTPase-activating protein gacZ-like [Zophobas morio]|uniref:rho GTPase-activating protein gacZ-like n=1 Tax=Zophobas morio TaxID=2755281 RepID=UPI003083A20A